MGDIRMKYDARWWIPVDVDERPASWVPDVIAERWVRDDLEPDTRQFNRICKAVIKVAEAVCGIDPDVIQALMLQPRADAPIDAVVSIRIETLDHPVTLEEAAREFVAPEDMREGAADVTEVDTSGGRAVRLRQRVRVPQRRSVDLVRESLVYLWLISEEGGPALLALSSSLDDLVLAETVIPLVDDLARTVVWVEE